MDPSAIIQELSRVTRDVDLLGADHIRMQTALRRIVSLGDKNISKAREIAGDALRAMNVSADS